MKLSLSSIVLREEEKQDKNYGYWLLLAGIVAMIKGIWPLASGNQAKDDKSLIYFSIKLNPSELKC